MRLVSEDRLVAPVGLLYALVRDDLRALLPYLPNIDDIQEISRALESDGRHRVVTAWTARVSVPATIQKLLPPDIFRWTDRALWNDRQRCVDYTLDGYGYEARGRNYFTQDGDSTIVKVTTTLTIRPEQFSIPKRLFNTVFPVLESTIKKAIAPNMTSLAQGIQGLLSARETTIRSVAPATPSRQR